MSTTTPEEKLPPVHQSFGNRMDHILNNDFCPQFNKYVYWMKKPISLAGFATVSSLLLAFFLNWTVFFAVLGMSTILLMAIVWPWVAIKGIRGELILDKRRSRVGEPVALKIKLTNKWPWPLWGLVVVKGFFEDSNDGRGMSLSRMPGWTTATFDWQFTPQRRGMYPLEMPQIETSFPLGLFSSQVTLTCRGELFVWPETFDLEGLPDTQSFHFQEQCFTDRKAGDCGDLLGTRRFREGDSLRRIHWGQTARTQNLVVCERQAPAATSLEMIIDAHGQDSPSFADEQQMEQVISIAASIVKSVVTQHGAISCHLNGSIFEPGKGHREYERLMDGLARIPRGGYTIGAAPSIPRYLRQTTSIIVGPHNSPLFASTGEPAGSRHHQAIRVPLPTFLEGEIPGKSDISSKQTSWNQRLAEHWKNGRLSYVQ